jgi:hypothetical protein
MIFILFVIFADILRKPLETQEKSLDVRKPLHRSHPNLATVRKIKELAEYRELYRKQKGKLPTWTSACARIAIGYRTVRRHAPELLKRWYDEEFHF